MTMHLKDFYGKLDELENGGEMKEFIRAQLTSRDNEISNLQSRSQSSETEMDTLATTLGVEKNQIADTVKQLQKDKQSLDKEKSKLETSLENEKSELEQAKNQYQDLKRSSEIESFSHNIGANSQVVKDMIGSDYELYTKEGEGYIKDSQGNEKNFKEFVKNDEKLKNYETAIFGVEQPKQQTLPTGKGQGGEQSSDSLSDAAKSYKTRRQSRASEIAKRFA